MLKYKALYKKMMDDLKDSGMWLDWAKELFPTCPKVAKFLYDSAKNRLEDSYPDTKEIFEHLCKEDKENKYCMNELVDDQFREWHEELMGKLKKVEKIMEEG